MIPVLNPSGVREFIEFGLHGYAMSRYSGCWVGFKSISDTIESSSSFEIDPMAVEIKVPDTYPIPADGFHIRWPDPPLEQENRLQRERLYALLEYVRLNRLNRQDWVAPQREARHRHHRQELPRRARGARDDGHRRGGGARRIGLRLLKIGVSWPLEPQCIREFAEGLDEILVVEEKRQIIEYQLKEQLYNAPPASRPRVVGKYDETGEWVQVPHGGILLSPNGELTPAAIANVDRRAHRQGARRRTRWAPSARDYLIECKAADGFTRVEPGSQQRLPYFCSGCPHNTSTKVPEGSRAMAGIGCHYMAQWMDRRTETFTQMGGEGATWIGQAPLHRHAAHLREPRRRHLHALRARWRFARPKAAGVNITYKILVNDAVAMTGGQPVEGSPTVPQILQQVAAEGVEHLHLVTDEPAAVRGHGRPAGRRRWSAIATAWTRCSASCARSKGVSVIVYAQTCAAEKRRRRKKKELVDPPKRVVINEEVCEGCGDCGVQIATACRSCRWRRRSGRKRTIDQSSCNKDYLLREGLLPELRHGRGRRAAQAGARARPTPPANLPAPVAARARPAVQRARHRRRRHRRRDDRRADGHGRAPRRQGRAGPRHGRAWRRRAAR